MATVLVASAGNSAAVVLVALVAVLSGQLSIGWSNDVVDRERDRAVGRGDKPLATGAVSPRTVTTAAAAAAVVTVVASLALGWRAGLAQLVVVSCGWLYNLGLKSTVLSPLPFFVAFASLPAVATLALPDPRWPPAAVLLAAGLVGVAAHAGNVLPDLVDDASTGVRGLPHHLGRFGAALAAAVCAVAATVLALASARPAVEWSVITLVVAAVMAVSGLVLVRRTARSEAAFYTTMAVAAIGVAMIAGTGALRS